MPETGRVRVSYLISTRNRAPFLERTLANVREFITAADELIVVDGASTDETPAVAARHSDIITRFLSEPDSGESHGYNKAILLARGEFLKFITDDDYLYPDAMRRLIDFFEQHTELEAVVCGGEVYEVDAGSQASRLVKYIRLPADMVLRENLDHVMRQVYCGVGLCLRRTVIARTGLLNPSFLPTDVEYMARLVAYQVPFVYLDIKLFRLHVHAHSGHLNWPRTERDFVRVLLAHGAWELIGNYPPEAVGKALGLWDQPGGPALMQLIAEAERARRQGRVRSLRGARLSLRGVEWLRAASQALRKWLRRAPEVKTAEPALVEPAWDGGQR